MCQIFAGRMADVKALLLETPGLIENVHRYNEDGIGAMYAHNGQLHIPKALAETPGEVRRLIEVLPDIDGSVAIHFRMKTHGVVDHDNCHPYPVVTPPRINKRAAVPSPTVALIHNGILAQGNRADPARSDTWHYARRLEEQLKLSTQLLHSAEWRRLIEQDIGSNNRFVLMDASGSMYTLNEDTGYTATAPTGGSVWVANTYSFDAEMLWPEMADPRASRWYESYGATPADPTELSWDGYARAVADAALAAYDENDVVALADLIRDEGITTVLDALYDSGVTLHVTRTSSDAYLDSIVSVIDRDDVKALDAVDATEIARVLLDYFTPVMEVA